MQEYAFWEFLSKKCQSLVILVNKPNFLKYWSREVKIFDVEISLAKAIIFTKIFLANGSILKLWTANPTLYLAETPVLDWFLIF